MGDSRKWEILSLASLGMIGTYVLVKKFLLKDKDLADQIRSQIPAKPDDVLSLAEDENISHQMRTKNTQLNLKRGLSTFARKSDNPRKRFKVFKICITGGPCAGKTTGMAFIAERLKERGFRVYTVPEAATLIAGGGGMIKTHEYNESDAIAFQTTLLETQIHLEDSFMELAYLAKDDAEDAVVLTDRGLMDGSAYMKPESWQALLDEKGLSEVNLRDKRYDAVIHLVTAADGAEEYYNLENTARYENTLEIAISVDRNIQSAWMGHHNRVVIDNRAGTTFEEKVQRLFEACCRAVGIPKQKDALYKRFLLLRNKQYLGPEIKRQHFEIEDSYIKVDHNEEEQIIIKIRKRGQGGLFTYTVSEIHKPNKKDKQNISTKRQLNPREYVTYLQQADPSRQTLVKERDCFVFEGKSFIIDTFKNVNGGFSILRVEVENSSKQATIPQFLKDIVARDVTNEKSYSSIILSKKKWLVPESDLGYFDKDSND